MSRNNTQERELSESQVDRLQGCYFSASDKLSSNQVTEILSMNPAPGDTSDAASEKNTLPRGLTSETSLTLPKTTKKRKTRKKTKNTFESKPVLKYNYKEDQWSPLNPEGKKQYDRDYLLQLRFQKLSLRKPPNLPNLDVIKDKLYVVDSIALNPGKKDFQSRPRGSSGGTKASTYYGVKSALINRNSNFSKQPSASKYEGRRDSQQSAASSRESSPERNNLLSPTRIKTHSPSKEKNDQQQLKVQTKTTESSESDSTHVTSSASSTSTRHSLQDTNIGTAGHSLLTSRIPQQRNSVLDHADFGLGGYQQYAFTSALPSRNSGHNMTKPVANEQPDMPYAASKPTSAQHQQSSMGGPVPSPQSIMQQGQQISRAPLSFYPRQSVPRSMPNMSRNPLTAVVNQTSQQATSQFSHVQMVPLPSYHMPPMIMNNFHQMYLQRPNYPQQYSITSQQAVYVNNWNNFNTLPPQSANGYYLPSSFKQFQTKTILDPQTGKYVLHDCEELITRPNMEGERYCDECYKRLHEVMKKLSFQNFHFVLGNIRLFPMNTESSICLLVDIMHEKATEETEASTTFLCAKFCKRLMLNKMSNCDAIETPQNRFQKLLFKKCSEELDLNKNHEKECRDVSEATQLVENDPEIHPRHVRNVRFIVELFKLDLLIEPMVIQLISKFSNQRNEKSLKRLFQLWKIIDRNLDEATKPEEARKSLKQNVLHKQLREIVKELSPESFGLLLEEILNLHLTNASLLNLLIDVANEKVVIDRSYASAWEVLKKSLIEKKTEPEKEEEICPKQIQNVRNIMKLIIPDELIEPIMLSCIDKLFIQRNNESLKSLFRIQRIIDRNLELEVAPKTAGNIPLA